MDPVDLLVLAVLGNRMGLAVLGSQMGLVVLAVLDNRMGLVVLAVLVDVMVQMDIQEYQVEMVFQ